MSETDRFEAQKFKPGQSGNPAGKAKGVVSGRLKALGAAGTFCWNELLTEHVDASVAFYAQIGGFTDAPMDMGPAGAYHVLESEGKSGEGVGRIHLDQFFEYFDTFAVHLPTFFYGRPRPAENCLKC